MSRTALALTACLALAAMTDAVSLGAQAPDPIRYTLRFPAPHTHYMEIEAVYPTGGRAEIDLFMAVWTPGSYLIREYQRHVEDLAAEGPDGRPRAIEKTAKNRWRVATGGAPSVTVTYRVYGREMTVRNNWIEAGFAMLNGAPTFISLVGGLSRPHEVRIEPATGWTHSATGLMPAGSTPHTYRAPDFDTLVDSPIVIGTPVLKEFTVDGKKHVLVLEGETGYFDADRAAADVQKLVEATRDFWGGLPYPHYYILNMVTDAGGGLEHKDSTLLMSRRFTTRSRASYLGWLSLVSHEFFHVWNIKRLRPIELGPFDYENENYTEALWIGEGFTDYYADVLVHRAGLSSRDELLDGISNQIEAVQTTPGRMVTSVGQSSFDTWIKQYRPDENTPNTTVNYYPKGAVIAFLLDAKIRQATGGDKSLDDAMRVAYSRYAGEKGYTLDQFYATMSEVAGTDLTSWFERVVSSTEELQYDEALAWFGLRFKPVDPKAAKAWLGVVSRSDGGRLVVTQVRRATPAYEAGVNVEDEIVAIDDVRVRADGLNARLEQYKPGDRVSLLVARRDELTRLDVTLGADPGRPWRLEVVPEPTEAQRQRLASWLAR